MTLPLTVPVGVDDALAVGDTDADAQAPAPMLLVVPKEVGIIAHDSPNAAAVGNKNDRSAHPIMRRQLCFTE